MHACMHIVNKLVHACMHIDAHIKLWLMLMKFAGSCQFCRCLLVGALDLALAGLWRSQPPAAAGEEAGEVGGILGGEHGVAGLQKRHGRPQRRW